MPKARMAPHQPRGDVAVTVDTTRRCYLQCLKGPAYGMPSCGLARDGVATSDLKLSGRGIRFARDVLHRDSKDSVASPQQR
jgi:hypothetical protein